MAPRGADRAAVREDDTRPASRRRPPRAAAWSGNDLGRSGSVLTHASEVLDSDRTGWEPQHGLTRDACKAPAGGPRPVQPYAAGRSGRLLPEAPAAPGTSSPASASRSASSSSGGTTTRTPSATDVAIPLTRVTIGGSPHAIASSARSTALPTARRGRTRRRPGGCGRRGRMHLAAEPNDAPPAGWLRRMARSPPAAPVADIQRRACGNRSASDRKASPADRRACGG